MAIKLDDISTLVKSVYSTNAVLFQNNFTALEMGEIATDTPQDTGRAKGNWDAGFDDNITPTPDIDLTRTGIRARRKALRQLAQPITSSITNKNPAKFDGRKTYIKNGVEGDIEDGGDGYIIKLEDGTGSSQAPMGMVLINIVGAERLSKKAMKL